jgi:hypothetical protein
MIVTYEVDYDDPNQLKKIAYKLLHRRNKVLQEKGYNGISFNGSNLHVGKVMPLFEDIYNTDLSSVYERSSISTNYYVYLHCDPTKKIHVSVDIKHLFLASKFNISHVPFYVGKGIGNRWQHLDRNDSHRKIRSKLIKQSLDIKPIKIIDNLSETQALEIESKLIDILGLKALSEFGMLVNLDEGHNAKERRSLYTEPCLQVLRRNGFIV